MRGNSVQRDALAADYLSGQGVHLMLADIALPIQRRGRRAKLRA